MYKVIKRFFDFCIALIGLIICSPIMAIVSIAIKAESKGPVIFKQDRIGKNGKVFKIYKFRSMCQGAEHTGSGVYSGSNDSRVTKVGKVIRKVRIDEIPQLMNIIAGDMSIVGPRAERPEIAEQYCKEQQH